MLRIQSIRSAIILASLLACFFAPRFEGQQAKPTGTAAVKPEAQAEAGAKQPAEDWAGLEALRAPVALKQALPGPEAELGSSDSGGFSRELIEAEWRTGDPIDLYIVKPKGVERPPVVLYLFSYPSELDRYKDNNYCDFLTRHGFAAVGFVSPLTGQRYHDIPQKKWFVSELPMTLTYSVQDVQLILDYLEKRGDMDMTRVGMFGDGSGATIAVLAAAVDSRIKAVDLLNPWGDWPDWFAHSTLVPKDERDDYLKPEFLSNLENLDPVKWLPRIKAHGRLQYVMKGVTVTPDVAKQRVAAVAPANVKVVRYENSQDFFKNVALTGTGFDWIKQQLTSPAQRQAPSKAAAPTRPSANQSR